MDAYQYQQPEINEATMWWNQLSTKQKLALCKKHFEDQNPFMLTTAAIQNIFNKETHG